jgi:cold shock CspA family protein
MLMLFRMEQGVGEMPALNSKTMDGYCNHLIKIINDRDAFGAAMKKAARVVEEIRKSLEPWREQPERTRAFTTALVAAISPGRVETPAVTTRSFGTVLSFTSVKGFGFIRMDDSIDNVFFHQSNVAMGHLGNIRPKVRVSFTLLEVPRGTKAMNIMVDP